MDTNPYGAPRAELHTESPLETYASAMRDFASTRLIIRILAVAALAAGAAAFLAVLLQFGSGLVLLAPGALYVVHGVMHWRLASRIVEAEAKPDLTSIAALLAGLRQSWLASLALYIATTLLSAIPAVATMMSIGALSVESALASNVSNEATRLRTVLRVMLAVVALSSVAMIWQQMHLDAPTAIRIVTQSFTAAIIGCYGLLVWQQLAPLGDFIATPNPQALRALARAHRFLWVMMFAAMALVFVCAVLAVFLMVLFAPMPEQR